ncbi:MAG: cbb3-type cytochrome oxidase assembly protein CcoS [Flavobacteriales bacterium]|nr:cbb3-type cytochrome oxidase assembly protein CcoS [Bacteroidota bacterium]MCB9240444.1 cbb3-type cytochrome oxidase assembly protein CcoS [Flavobacteriales bacterium]
MKVIAILIAASMLLAGIFLALFFFAVKKGQFDDLESPGFRILNESDGIKKRKLNN